MPQYCGEELNMPILIVAIFTVVVFVLGALSGMVYLKRHLRRGGYVLCLTDDGYLMTLYIGTLDKPDAEQESLLANKFHAKVI